MLWTASAVTHSSVLAGMLVSAMQIVRQGFALFGGTFVDRHNRRTLMLVDDLTGAVLWLGASMMLLSGHLSCVFLVAVACVVCAVDGLCGGATDAILRAVVPTADYPRARSLNEGRDASVSLAGGPAAGLLYAVASWMPFGAMSLCDLAAAFAASRLPAMGDSARRPDAACRSGFLDDYVEGWHWSLRHRRVPLFAGVACLMNFGANGMIYAVQLHLIDSGAEAWHVGTIEAGAGLAMLVGSLVASRLSSRISVSVSMVVTLSCYAVCMVPMVVSDGYPSLLVCSSLAFIPLPLFNAMVMGFILAKTPNRMQGRVSMVVAVPAQLLSMCTGAVSGVLLDKIGFGGAIAVCLCAVLCALAVTMACPSLRHVPDITHWDETEL